eukprot:TRINITY_DN12387_c0_g1_i6.p1 TRINITY_DN12387_c0_g1~~TRINITY_DN12387_c0_g1_i6.p1  ORF type:complete len:205 (-),score=27.31 TRINITY_DN12387_c0_g1_i6:145-759(-)
MLAHPYISYYSSRSFITYLSLFSLLFSFFFVLIIRRPPRSTLSSSSAASDVYKRQQPNCVKLTDQTSCEADSRCAYFAEKKTCNDVNAPNCPSAAVNLQGCIDYVTGLWKAGDTTCDALRVHCENCVDGDCTGAGPTPPTPTPPTPTPPSPGKTCKWETATVACKADADCGTWASANCNPGEVNWYCKPNGFCHFGAIVQVFQL